MVLGIFLFSHKWGHTLMYCEDVWGFSQRWDSSQRCLVRWRLKPIQFLCSKLGKPCLHGTCLVNRSIILLNMFPIYNIAYTAVCFYLCDKSPGKAMVYRCPASGPRGVFDITEHVHAHTVFTQGLMTSPWYCYFCSTISLNHSTLSKEHLEAQMDNYSNTIL